MSLTFGLTSAKDLFAKVQRDAAHLDREVSSDALFNFVVTAYSLIDWLRNDPTVPTTAKTQSEIESLYKDKWLRVCGDLATAAKHFMLTSRKPATTSATSARGWGMGRYGKGGYGVGEESISIKLSDGTSFTALELAQGVVASWQRFFARHSL